jgi:transposase
VSCATGRTTCISRAYDAERSGVRCGSLPRALDRRLAAAVTNQAPELLKVRGVGPVVAATVRQAWSHPGRVHSEAAFAALVGAAPLPASSGNTRRHRLNRRGDWRLTRALYTIALTRLGHDPRTRAYLARLTAQGSTRRRVGSSRARAAITARSLH